MNHPARPFARLPHLALFAAAATLVVGGTGGCKPAEKPIPATQPAMNDPQAMRSLKQVYQQVNPQAVIGTVSAVAADAPFAEVSDLPSGGVQPGAVMSFLDADQKVVALGEVNTVGADGKASVKFTPQEGAAGRKPRVGDLALHFPDASGGSMNAGTMSGGTMNSGTMSGGGMEVGGPSTMPAGSSGGMIMQP